MEKSSVNACMSVFGFQWKHAVCIIELWDINGLQHVKGKVSMKSVFVHVCVTGLPLLGKITISLSGRPALFDHCSRGKTTEGNRAWAWELEREREWQSKGETENTNQGRTWEKISLFNHSSNFQFLSTAEEKEWKGERSVKISFSPCRYRSITLFLKSSELPICRLYMHHVEK